MGVGGGVFTFTEGRSVGWAESPWVKKDSEKSLSHSP